MQTVQQARQAARVLVVDDEPAILDIFNRIVGRESGCDILTARTIGQARELIRHEPIDLLITDVNLPDGVGLGLLDDLHKHQPAADAVVMSGDAGADGAIGAIRAGALDFIQKPFSADELADRVRSALCSQHKRVRQNLRLNKLRHTVRKLGAARKAINRKVDLLCNDLIQAYGELSRNIDTVRIQSSFNGCISRSANLEQLLCHSMDWFLRQVGYCNIGIWLIGTDQELQLGAYMKYTQAADEKMMEALASNLIPRAARAGFVKLNGDELKKALTQAEFKYLHSQEVLAVNCTYLGEVLGVICLFRDEKTPFSEVDVSALKTVCPLFALALARSVRGPGAAAAGEEDDFEPDDHADTLPPEPGKAKPRRDPADWWKNGDAAPF